MSGGSRIRWYEVVVASCLLLIRPASAVASDFVNFESSHVHPIALSDSGDRLFAVNTPEARLAVFRVNRRGELAFDGDIQVGLEPVSLAVRPGTTEVWVANHLSDSVSVVDAAAKRLIATLQVGDEPTDVVFANDRAFISLAGNQDKVVVYDVASRERIEVLDIFGDDPRAMAVSSDGKRVALVVLESGSATTTVHQSQLSPERPPPQPNPPRSVFFPPGMPELPAPAEPLIVQQDAVSSAWLDETGGDWSDLVFFPFGGTVPDYDLFWIDAESDPPVIESTVSRVGTSLFDVSIHPKTGAAWVPNTDARNVIRFEPILRGHLVETRITKIDPVDSTLESMDLNPHIDYSTTPGPLEESRASLAIPGDGTFDRRGKRYYLTAFGSSKVAVFDGRNGKLLKRIDVTGGPSGVALNSRARRLYVMQRFSNTISIVDTKKLKMIASIGVAGPHAFDPSPPEVRDGRHLLYDGQLSSGHGDISCATCHVFGNFDGVAWDLGDPWGEFIPFTETPWLDGILSTPHAGFDPMKGPMVTQTLRGLRGTEPFHWRGDRENLPHFNGAFVSLLGRDTPLSESEIQAFSNFMMSIEYPPNPERLLDDGLPTSIRGHGDPRVGQDVFLNVPFGAAGLSCVDCHFLPFGTNNEVQVIGDQSLEVAHLRNVYEKLSRDRFNPGDTPPGYAKSGFGIQHSGSQTLGLFLAITVTTVRENIPDLTAFLASFSSGTFPCVGRQVSVTSDSTPDQLLSLDILVEQSDLERCDVVAKGMKDGVTVGYVYDQETGLMMPDSTHGVPDLYNQLADEVSEDEVLTFTGVPVGSGRRLGTDRDRDGCLDADESRQQSDPANPGEPRPDADDDGLPDDVDLCPGWRQLDHAQKDRDGNGIPDECECGDVSDDGKLNRDDIRIVRRYLKGKEAKRKHVIEKCNVTGAPGDDPSLCTVEDLETLRAHVFIKGKATSKGSSGDPAPLELACWPQVAPSTPPPMVCVD